MITGIIRDAYWRVYRRSTRLRVRALVRFAARWLDPFVRHVHHSRTLVRALAAWCNCIVKVLQSDSRRLCENASRCVASRRRPIERTAAVDVVKVVQPPGSSFENLQPVRAYLRHARANLVPRVGVRLLKHSEGKICSLDEELDRKTDTSRGESMRSFLICFCRRFFF